MKSIKKWGYTFTLKKDINYKIEGYNLEQVYNTYSYFKARAFSYCIKMINDIEDSDGVEVANWGISSHNNFMFTFLIVVKDNNEDKSYKILITPSYNYISELED